MSWSVSAAGTKDEVRAAITAQFDSCAKHYEGQEEGKDIDAARERAMTALDELDLGIGMAEGQPARNASVSAWGSRSSWDNKPVHVEFHVTVTRVDPAK